MKKGNVILFIIFLISLILPLVSAQVMINEVMPNPTDDCNDCTEWLEIYSDSETNLSLWIIDAGGKNTTLDLFIEDYLVITKNKTKFLELWQIDSSKVIEGKTSLNNDGDDLFLYNENNIVIDSLTCPSINQDESYVRIDSSWVTCDEPTPAQENACLEPEPGPEPECEVDEDCDDNDENTIDSCEGGQCVHQEIEQEESYLAITDAPEEATFGDILNINTNIYRGDTRKYAVYIQVEDKEGKQVSEEIVLHVFTKHVNYSIKVPIQLKLNCDEKYSEDDYNIILEGLDEKTTKEVHLESKSSLCGSTSASSSSKATATVSEDKEESAGKEQPIAYENSGYDSNTKSEQSKITGNVIEDKAATTLKTVPYLLSVLCLLIAIYAIKTKKG